MFVFNIVGNEQRILERCWLLCPLNGNANALSKAVTDMNSSHVLSTEPIIAFDYDFTLIAFNVLNI